MFKCDEENREIPLDSLAYVVEHPCYGAKRRLIVGEKAMERIGLHKRCDSPFEKGDKVAGLNVYSLWSGSAGKPRKGRFLFSLPAMSLLTTLPETFHTYWELPD